MMLLMTLQDLPMRKFVFHTLGRTIRCVLTIFFRAIAPLYKDWKVDRCLRTTLILKRALFGVKDVSDQSVNYNSIRKTDSIYKNMIEFMKKNDFIERNLRIHFAFISFFSMVIAGSMIALSYMKPARARVYLKVLKIFFIFVLACIPFYNPELMIITSPSVIAFFCFRKSSSNDITPDSSHENVSQARMIQQKKEVYMGVQCDV